MEQGTRLDSIRMPAAQDVRDDAGEDRALDAAVAALLAAPSEKVTAPEPDPILAAIAETRRLMRARHAANDLPQPAGSIDPLPEQDAACDAFFAHINNVLLKTTPTTGAGCAALARYAVEFRANEGFNLDEDQSNEQHVRILDLIARSPLAAPASPSASDLAIACVEQIKRLEQWDENPDAVSEKQGDEEMDRWNAVFRRAIDEPSTCLRDLAGKAYLMLADLDRFMPEDAEQYQYDNYRLMRVIMREAIAMGGLADPEPTQTESRNEVAPHVQSKPAPHPASSDVDTVKAATKEVEAKTPKHGYMERPPGAHTDAYGLLVDERGAGLFMPPGSQVLVEPVPPEPRGFAVMYGTSGRGPSIWQVGPSFKPEHLNVGEDDTVSVMIELFDPIDGRRGHVDAHKIEKLHRIRGVSVSIEIADTYGPGPRKLPLIAMSEDYLAERVTGAESYPLLLEGDFAVVDPRVTTPEHGGLFMLRWGNGSTSFLQTNLRAIGSGQPLWWVDPVNRPHGPSMLDKAFKSKRILYTSDGPFGDIDHLASNIIGKVIGVLNLSSPVNREA